MKLLKIKLEEFPPTHLGGSLYPLESVFAMGGIVGVIVIVKKEKNVVGMMCLIRMCAMSLIYATW